GRLNYKLRIYRCTRYDAELAAVAAEATAWIDQRAGQVARPALVLDIDETSLDEILQNDYGYIPGGGCDLGGRGACGVARLGAQRGHRRSTRRRPVQQSYPRASNLVRARNIDKWMRCAYAPSGMIDPPNRATSPGCPVSSP